MSATRIEFTVEAVESDASGPVICGRCCESDIVLGDTFTELRRVWFARDTNGHLEHLGSEHLAAVSLVVSGIGIYGRSVARISHGCTAGIQLSGVGLDVIAGFEDVAETVGLLVGERV